MSVVEELAEHGVNAHQYYRGPLGKHVFTMRVSPLKGSTEGQVSIWPAGAEFQVYGDDTGEFRQAVMRYIEKNHEIALGNFRLRTPFSALPVEFWGQRKVGETIQRVDIANRNSIPNLPEETEFVLASVPTDKAGFMVASIVAEVPYQDQSVLMGMDETYHFISALEGHPRSVKSAHRMLKPKGLRGDWKRQGEWFFVPATREEKATIEKTILRDGIKGGWDSRTHVLFPADGDDSSHVALVAVRAKSDLYTIGYVYDTRGGHHAPLHLDDWHRIVRNNEVELESEALSTTYWD